MDLIKFRYHDGWFKNPPFRLHWSTLRSFGDNRAVRSSYFWFIFVPIAARLNRQLNQPLQSLFFGADHHTIWIDLPFSWYTFYFASIAFSFATILYSAFCPEIVKKFGSPIEFYSAGHGGLKLLEYFSKLPKRVRDDIFTLLFNRALKNQKPPMSPAAQQQYTAVTHSETDDEQRYDNLSGLLLNIQREEMNDVFSAIYDHYDIANLKLRLVVTWLNYLGIVLFGWTALRSISVVIGMFVSEFTRA